MQNVRFCIGISDDFLRRVQIVPPKICFFDKSVILTLFLFLPLLYGAHIFRKCHHAA
jgi:hypothetical protein